MAPVVPWVFWKGVGETPVIVEEPGEILIVPLLWFVDRKRLGLSSQTLYQGGLALVRFHEFWLHYKAHFQSVQQLLRGFWLALIRGDSNLGWTRIQKETAVVWCGGWVECQWAAMRASCDSKLGHLFEPVDMFRNLARGGIDRQAGHAERVLPKEVFCR